LAKFCAKMASKSLATVTVSATALASLAVLGWAAQIGWYLFVFLPSQVGCHRRGQTWPTFSPLKNRRRERSFRFTQNTLVSLYSVSAKKLKKTKVRKNKEISPPGLMRTQIKPKCLTIFFHKKSSEILFS
jgi:phenylpropionate dioxygenase-like ring-hydroxylating dioxygenase large terminal subunit